MFKNYLKLAIKILGRRKFYTFISLFGISFTLMILMVLTAFLDHEFGNHAPISKRDNMVFLSRIIMKKERTDTIRTVDSTMVNHQMQYDTTINLEVNGYSSYSSSNGGFPLFDEHLRNIDGSVAQTIYSDDLSFDVYLNNKKLVYEGVYTDADFWKILDFNISLLQSSILKLLALSFVVNFLFYRNYKSLPNS